MSKFKNVMSVASALLAILTGVCSAINTGVDSIEKIKEKN